jgi:hypothetical protein
MPGYARKNRHSATSERGCGSLLRSEGRRAQPARATGSLPSSRTLGLIEYDKRQALARSRAMPASATRAMVSMMAMRTRERMPRSGPAVFWTTASRGPTPSGSRDSTT